MVKGQGWADKYLHSDHHQDRKAQDIVFYQKITGHQHPEPAAEVLRPKYRQQVNMTLGRGYEMENWDDDYSYGARKAYQISSAAADDSDAISYNSRVRDAHLLNDVTARLENAPYVQPVTVIRKHVKVSGKPPLPRTCGGVQPVRPVRASRVVSSSATRLPPRSMRAASVPPPQTSVDERVEDYSYKLPPKQLFAEQHKRGMRAASVPVSRSVADLAVRQAKQSLDRIERELGVTGYSDVSVDPYYSEPRPAPVSYHYRPRQSSVPPVHVPSSSRYAEIEARLETMVPLDDVPSSSFQELRNKTTLVKNKMDAHKTLLDRYLPVPMGPHNEVEYEVQSKYGEIACRIPALDPHNAYASYYNPTSQVDITPTKSRVPDYTPPPPFKAVMSDTRQRLRDAICKGRQDRHYFD